MLSGGTGSGYLPGKSLAAGSEGYAETLANCSSFQG
jgi:hypothetical protein